jgi:4-hydroxy-2-oxoheptanedioate aldolase
VVLMAEHVQAIEHADEIMSVPGIDVMFIGPNDLHNSMGKAPAFDSDDQQFNDAVDHILQTAKKHGIAAGIHVIDAAAAQRRLAQGFQFIAITSEAGMMLAKAGEVAKTLGLGKGAAVARY